MASLNYDSPLALKALLEERGWGMRKKWGQNFLIKGAIRKKLAAALEIEPGDEVWEIGPGLGAMTRELLELGARVKAFEIDPGFTDFLRGEFGGADFSLVPGDVLKTWKREAEAPFLLGNLPYNIAAVLLGDLIEGNRFFRRMVVTVQKEVGRRLTARPGEADYSSITVLVAGRYDVKPLMVMGASCFYPPPRVDSLGLRFDLRENLPAAETGETTAVPLLYPLVRRLFSFRRKTVKNSLGAFVSSRPGAGPPAGQKDLVMAALERCGISPGERPENLDVSRFQELARQLQYLGLR
ncbi:MAG: 16S rRNA (adenine(1518)-N(6)/adenine(1519)-N(6))-dimethyltransferase RsmA [Treponema sp.]|jgi:16S rRNA (adenine1518-N6/adenine1519-N6)-dimethyltransferase|nr:16S rRNA (adenine(1518)-N(6)/adenine(1519)-N(6))-dimethyltransferase RsmA [Treponema sp.]